MFYKSKRFEVEGCTTVSVILCQAPVAAIAILPQTYINIKYSTEDYKQQLPTVTHCMYMYTDTNVFLTKHPDITGCGEAPEVD